MGKSQDVNKDRFFVFAPLFRSGCSEAPQGVGGVEEDGKPQTDVCVCVCHRFIRNEIDALLFTSCANG